MKAIPRQKVNNSGRISVNSEKFYGVYRGIVKYNKDSMCMGRVRIQIPQFHGVDSLKDDEYPYAFPCFMGAGYDSGSLMVPEIGTTVWVMFEDGDTQKPVYIGGMYSSKVDKVTYQGNTENQLIYGLSKGEAYKPAYKDDMFEAVYKEDLPVKKIVFKTPKGASLEVDERDEEERLTLMDRVGQFLLMYSPVKAFANMNNASRRGKVDYKQPFDKGSIKDKSILMLKGIRSSFLRIVEHKGKAKTELIARDKDRDYVGGIYINVGEDNKIDITMYNGETIGISISDEKVTIDAPNIDIKCNTFTVKTGSCEILENQSYSPSLPNWVDTKDEEQVKE